jgi:hypothetical protein
MTNLTAGGAPPDRELVDPGSPPIQTGIHDSFSIPGYPLMLRQTRSRLVTEIDIVPARRWCNMIKSNSFFVQILGSSHSAFNAAMTAWSTHGLSPRLRHGSAFLGNVAGAWRGFVRSSRTSRGLP